MEIPSTTRGIVLNWIQPSSFERRFELHSENGVLGKLNFETVDAACGSLTSTDQTTESWTFKRVGLLNSHIIIRAAGTNDNVAIYRPKFFGDGWIEFTKGSKFHWQSINGIGSKWGFANEQEEILLAMKSNWYSLLKIQASIEIEPKGQGLEEMPLLLISGWYLMVRGHYAGI